MDVKQWDRWRLLLVLFLVLGACQKKLAQPTEIITDKNSQFAGKSCYGRAKSNQYILTWSDGSISIFKGTYSELEIQLQEQLRFPYVVLAEQDREIDFFENAVESADIVSMGTFWQVWALEDIQANELWEKNIKGEGVTVAVIDTGIDLSHPSLADRIQINKDEIPDNGLDDDQNGIIDDYKGYDFANDKPYADPVNHGSHVAGIIAAEPKGGPMLGVASQAKILPLNIMSGKRNALAAALLAIKYAVDRRVRVINASWGGPVCSESLKLVISEAAKHNVLFVSAAGNDGIDIGVYPEFPAAFGVENQISVGASVQSGLMAAFSNYGRTHVDILAPGHQILSTVPGGWMLASGTSMAAPYVSGLAALLWSAHPEATMAQVKTAILRSVVSPQTYNPVASQGRINAPLSLYQLESSLKSAVSLGN